MATINPTAHLSGLARRLVMDGLLAEAEAAKAQETALKKRTHFACIYKSSKRSQDCTVARRALPLSRRYILLYLS